MLIINDGCLVVIPNTRRNHEEKATLALADARRKPWLYGSLTVVNMFGSQRKQYPGAQQ